MCGRMACAAKWLRKSSLIFLNGLHDWLLWNYGTAEVCRGGLLCANAGYRIAAGAREFFILWELSRRMMRGN